MKSGSVPKPSWVVPGSFFTPMKDDDDLGDLSPLDARACSSTRACKRLDYVRLHFVFDFLLSSILNGTGACGIHSEHRIGILQCTQRQASQTKTHDSPDQPGNIMFMRLTKIE
eukprot:scaffold2720_cov173-Amphora_coffeaeformis.AAC.23